MTTVEDTKFTIELSCQGFVVVSRGSHDLIEISEPQDYFETPYSLLDSVSPGYQAAFGANLASQLRKLSEQQNKQ